MNSTAASVDTAHVAVFPPALFLGAMVVGLLLHWRQPIHPLPSWPARGIGAALFIGSAVLAQWGKRLMIRAGTNVRPDEPTTAIVTEGPFRYSRNPLYVATVGVYLGVALLVNGLWPVVLVVPAILVLQWGVITREERYLAAKFGEPYLAYKKRVRRWL
ncbi:MAG: isoprenylcysteine carboxylmethyltransferase family protein [bacterium]